MRIIQRTQARRSVLHPAPDPDCDAIEDMKKAIKTVQAPNSGLAPEASDLVNQIVRAARKFAKRIGAALRAREGKEKVPKTGGEAEIRAVGKVEEAVHKALRSGEEVERLIGNLHTAMNPPPNTPIERLDRLESDVKAALVWFRPLRESHQKARWSDKRFPDEHALARSFCDFSSMHDRAMQIAEEQGLPFPPLPCDPDPLHRLRQWIHETRPKVLDHVDHGSAVGEGKRNGGENGGKKPKQRGPAWSQLEIIKSDTGNDLARLDGKDHRLTGANDASFLEVVKEKHGTPILAKNLESTCGERPARIYDRLPKAIQRIIDKPGRGTGKKGYRML